MMKLAEKLEHIEHLFINFAFPVFTMEESTTCKKKNLVNHLQRELVGKVTKRTILIKITNESLLTNGEICFPVNLLAWRGFIQRETDATNCSNILEYYLRRKNCKTEDLSIQDIVKKATQCLIAASEKWPMRIEKCSLQKSRVCVFLSRREIVESAIKEALRRGIDYGKMESAGKSICFRVNEDRNSELTTKRLNMIKEVSERVLGLRGFQIVETDADYRYLLTTKSQGLVEAEYNRYVCGVVKNQNYNTKETFLTWSEYIERKIKQLVQLNEVKILQFGEKSNLENIARAIVTFELLSVKPSRPVFVRTNEDFDKGISNSKGGSFALYNTARISAILERFKEEKCLGNYPSLSDVNNVDFSQLNQEEEWELVYNFILAYPEMIVDSVRNEPSLETCPQTICLFLSRLSKNFSVYYRRTRILTEGRDHLVPTMMARLHLLRALQIVVNNSLAILNIVPVSHM